MAAENAPVIVSRRGDHRLALTLVRIRLNRAVRIGALTEAAAAGLYEDTTEAVEAAVKEGQDWMQIIQMILEFIMALIALF